ncbi:MAG: hypothetical protein HQM04_17380 [Magnetococcales bacterium]|nr:hypothetical protein [Magnetococcales bacterium]MBF0116803.1 hypothetical protein [Magnetococcales bacterium]
MFGMRRSSTKLLEFFGRPLGFIFPPKQSNWIPEYVDEYEDSISQIDGDGNKYWIMRSKDRRYNFKVYDSFIHFSSIVRAFKAILYACLCFIVGFALYKYLTVENVSMMFAFIIAKLTIFFGWNLDSVKGFFSIFIYVPQLLGGVIAILMYICLVLPVIPVFDGILWLFIALRTFFTRSIESKFVRAMKLLELNAGVVIGDKDEKRPSDSIMAPKDRSGAISLKKHLLIKLIVLFFSLSLFIVLFYIYNQFHFARVSGAPALYVRSSPKQEPKNALCVLPAGALVRILDGAEVKDDAAGVTFVQVQFNRQNLGVVTGWAGSVHLAALPPKDVLNLYVASVPKGKMPHDESQVCDEVKK